MSYDAIIAMHAQPGQFVETVSGNVYEVLRHEGGLTYLKSTAPMQAVYGEIPAGNESSMLSYAPIKGIRQHA